LSDLSEIFKCYREGQEKAANIAQQLQRIFADFRASEQGGNIENMDDFHNLKGQIPQDIDHHVSALREQKPDPYGEISEIVLNVFAEGKITVESQRRQASDGALIEQATKALHFAFDEPEDRIAGRVLSALVDSTQNVIADYFGDFLNNHRLAKARSPEVLNE